MAVELVRPNATLNSGWGGSNPFTLIDDATTQPTAGGTSDYAYCSGDSSGAQQYGCASPTATGSITSAKLWVYLKFDSNADGDISAVGIRLNGVWRSGTLTGKPSSGAWGWASCTMTGEYGGLSSSAPAFELTYSGATSDGEVYVDVAYLDLTYVATITKTIKASGGDYASPSAAATAVQAGTISGATAGDDVVLSIEDNTLFDSLFAVTSLAVAYNSVTLTAGASVRHNGTTSTGAGISRTTGTSGHLIQWTVNDCSFIVEWLRITTNGGKYNSGIFFSNSGTGSGVVNIARNNLIYNNGQPTAAQCDAIRSTNNPVRIHNNVIWNWKSQSTFTAMGINFSAGTGSIERFIANNTIYDIDCSGSGTCRGITFSATTSTCYNNAIAKIGSTTSGTKEGIGGSVPATRGYNATSDSTATGTGSITSLIEADAWSSPSTGDFVPKNSGALYLSGIDLVTTPAGVQTDIKGFDRDTSGLAWSIGAYQEGSTPADTISLTTPVSRQTRQRDGSGNATFSVTGTYSNAVAGGGIQYRWSGGAWATLVASPTGGTYSTTVTLPTGQGTFEVRLTLATSVTASATYVTVGDIYAIYGQSNASGRGTNSRTYSGSFVVNQYAGSGWQNLTDPADSDSWYLDAVATDSGAAAGHWCHKMATDLMTDLSVPIGIMIVAKGGTGITSFKASANHLDRATLYGSLNYHINAIGGVKCVLWWQGETDALAFMSQATYNGHLDTIANDLQSDRGIKLMSCLLQNSSGIPDVDEQKIRDAVTEAVGNNSNVLLGPNFSAIGSDDAYHFTSNTTVDNAGALWADAIITAFFPSLTAVTVGTSSVALVGTASAIGWTSVGIGSTVDIKLSLNSGSSFPITIVSATANDGAYSWTPEAAHVTATGVIRVVDAANAAYYDDQAVIVATTSATAGGGVNSALRQKVIG